jgi:hypothetical protein
VSLPASSAMRVLGVAYELGELLGRRATLERCDRVDDRELDANACAIRHAESVLLEACAAYATACKVEPRQLARLSIELARLARPT